MTTGLLYNVLHNLAVQHEGVWETALLSIQDDPYPKYDKLLAAAYTIITELRED